MKILLVSTCIAAVLLSGCGDSKQEDKKEVKKVEVVMSKEDKTKATINEVAQNLKVSTNKAIDKAAVMAEDLSEKTTEVMSKAVEKTKDISSKAVEKIAVMKKSLDKKMTEVTTSSAEKGKILYLRCAGCHGLKGEKKALGKSAVIQGWDEEKTTKVLKGYKDGSYGAAMKAIMIGQVKALSDEDLENMSAYIATF